MADLDAQDRKNARIAGIALVVLSLLALGIVALFVPAAGDFISSSLTPGVDLKGAAFAAFIGNTTHPRHRESDVLF